MKKIFLFAVLLLLSIQTSAINLIEVAEKCYYTDNIRKVMTYMDSQKEFIRLTTKDCATLGFRPSQGKGENKDKTFYYLIYTTKVNERNVYIIIQYDYRGGAITACSIDGLGFDSYEQLKDYIYDNSKYSYIEDSPDNYDNCLIFEQLPVSRCDDDGEFFTVKRLSVLTKTIENKLYYKLYIEEIIL